MVDKSRRGGKERRRKADAESPPGKGGFCEGWSPVSRWTIPRRACAPSTDPAARKTMHRVSH